MIDRPYLSLRFLSLLLFLLTIRFSIVAADELRIGVIGPFNNPRVEYLADPYRNGIELAQDEITGLWAGSKLHLGVVFSSDSAVPLIAQEEAKRLIDDRSKPIQLIIGSVNTACTLPVAAVCALRRIPLIVPISTGTKITEVGRGWVFRVTFSDKVMLQAIMEYLRTNGFHHIAFLYVDDPYGNGAASDLRAIVTSINLNEPTAFTVVYNNTFREGQTDFSSEISGLSSVKPDAVGLIGLTPEVSQIVRQIRARGFAGCIFVTTANSTEFYIQQAQQAAEGTIGITSYDELSGKSRNVNFVNAYTTRFGKPPNNIAAQAYDALYLAASECKVFFDSHRRLPSPSELRDVLAQTRYEGVIGPMLFDPLGERHADVTLLRVTGGEYMPLNFHPPLPSVPPFQVFYTYRTAILTSCIPVLLAVLLLHPTTARWVIGLDIRTARAIAHVLLSYNRTRWWLLRSYRSALQTSLKSHCREDFFSVPLEMGGDWICLEDPMEILGPLFGTDNNSRWMSTVGPSGTGKSFLLSHLAVGLCQTPPLAARAAVPIFIDCRYFDGNLDEAIRRGMGQFTVASHNLELLADLGCLLLLVDGVSEIPNEHLTEFINQLCRFRRGSNRCILTSRVSLRQVEDCCDIKVRLDELNGPARTRFLSHFNLSQRQLDQLEAALKGHLRNIPVTPLILRLLADSFRVRGVLPTNYADILRDFAAELLKHTHEESAGLLFALREVAFNFFWLQHGKRGFTQQQLVHFLGELADELKNWNVKCSAYDVVTTLIKCGLLRGSGLLLFSHDSLEDFFCAAALEERMRTGNLQLPANELNSRVFEGVERFLIALLEGSENDMFRSMNPLISSNEMTAHWRSRFPDISKDSVSSRLVSPHSRQLADEFCEKVYPMVSRHISIRAGFFCESLMNCLRAAIMIPVFRLGLGYRCYFNSRIVPK